MTVRTRPPLPLAPLGYRRDGRPIFPILGASPDDPGNSPTGETTPESTDTATVTIPQEELSRRFAREKDQGRRAGVRDLLSQLGFESAKALTEYVQAQREADQQQKDAEQARLSEAERREQTAAERERQAQEREAAAVARERDAARRAVLVGLGATGTELEDAVVLLGRLVDPDADDTALARAADELKERRPELFGQRAPQPPTTPPSGSPSNIPGRSGGTPARPGQLGLDIARRRGHLKSS
ncbi:hypothetical protein OG393_18770 [Streptomyces sp. NBC_01216]|uniref:hypothetical protein n=1 Tax=Streptomyces sp. NBC_01216 TaxID=2903778 RepID=UPI002E0F2491|nr:hypothetical protein OG393_18770 [Streptomyces sp. NBC_01216]